jgi:hypothetical protein
VTGRPPKLQPDAAPFERVAAGGPLRKVAPDCDAHVSRRSRFLRTPAGAGELAGAGHRAAQGGREVVPIRAGRLPGAGCGEAAFLARRDADCEGRAGRASGQPRNSFLDPDEWLDQQAELARVDGNSERREEIGRARAGWEIGARAN